MMKASQPVTLGLLGMRATLAAGAIVIHSACGEEPPSAVVTVPGLSGTIVVPNKTRSTATIADVATGRTLATLPTGPEPHEIALSGDGRTAVTTSMGGNTLTVIDVAERRVARTLDLGRYDATHGIAFLPGDSLVAVTSRPTRHIVIANVLTGTVSRAIATPREGSHILVTVANGSRIYTSDSESNTISELDPAGGRFLRSFDVPKEPEGMTVTPDGAELWVGSSTFFRGQVNVLDTRTGAVTRVARMFGWPYRIHMTPDARTVLVPDIRRGTLRFIDRASRRDLGRLQYPGGGEPGGLALTPDGRYAFQSLMSLGRVAIIDVAARRVVGSIPVGEMPDGIVYTSHTFPKPRAND